MCSRPAIINLGFAVALVVMVAIISGCCRYSRRAIDGSRLDVRLTAVDSPGEIERIIRTSLSEKYSATNMADGYTMFPVTNGPTHWLFVQVANAPRGLAMFKLLCYEQERAGEWLLRAYVPINEYYYTNGDDRLVAFKIDDDNIKVVFRGAVIFTGACKKEVAKSGPD